MTLLPVLLLAAGFLVDPAAPPPTPHPFDRIAVIGASVTWGYGTHVPFKQDRYTHRELITLGDVLEATLDDRYDLVHHQANLLFFNSPVAAGAALARNAEPGNPTLLVALDYLFWYGYGDKGVDGRPHQDPGSRVTLLKEGLAHLASFNCPVVISDFPDMSPAIGRILRASQVPTPEELETLNNHLKAWAADRDNIIIFPLAALTRQLQTDEGFQIEGLVYPAGSTATMIQPDALHPTTEGDIVLVQAMLRNIDTHSDDVTATDYHQDPAAVRSRLEDIARHRLESRTELESPVSD